MTHHNYRIIYFLIFFLIISLTFQLKAETKSKQLTTKNWSLKIANWNLMNFGDNKAGYPPPLNDNLLNHYADKMKKYDIIFIQEVLNSGQSVTGALAGKMTGYTCSYVSQASGRAGRPERYGVCYHPSANNGALVLDSIDDFMGQTKIAVDGSSQTAQDIWMRPPIKATFAFTPDDGAPISFVAYNIHTKPCYSANSGGDCVGGLSIPPGTPAGAKRHDSVKYELQALETNHTVGQNSMVLGDLNADCAYFPKKYHNSVLSSWHWYIQAGSKTNTARRKHCAYDRVILNSTLNTYYQDHGIVAVPHASEVGGYIDNQIVSDHYLVWVKIGKEYDVIKKPTIAIYVQAANPAKRRRVSDESEGPIVIDADDMDVEITPGTVADVYVVEHDSARDYKSNIAYSLTDVRGAPTTVTITSSGGFSQNVVWNNPDKGLYNVIIDVNQNGLYERYNGDFANSNNEIDFIVVDGSEGHNQLVTLDDNGNVREDFSVDKANHVNMLAKNLPTSTDVDVYVVSQKLLLDNGFTTWSAAKQAGNIQIAGYAIPVNRTNGLIDILNLTLADKKQTVTTGDDGSLFYPIWRNPAQLMSLTTFNIAPYVPDDHSESLAKYDPEGIRDACEVVDENSTQEAKEVCRFNDYAFSDHYGRKFNVIIDVNRNGIIDTTTVVDSHDIGDMASFFITNNTLDETANGDAAISEYKEYLNAKLNLSTPLVINNTYDADTKAASNQYMCSETLPKFVFDNVIKAGAEVGFNMLERAVYKENENINSGLYNYESVTYEDVTLNESTRACHIVEKNLELNNVTHKGDSQHGYVGKGMTRLSGNLRVEADSNQNVGKVCIAATTVTGATATVFAIAAGGAVTGTISVFSGGLATPFALSVGAAATAEFSCMLGWGT